MVSCCVMRVALVMASHTPEGLGLAVPVRFWFFIVSILLLFPPLVFSYQWLCERHPARAGDGSAPEGQVAPAEHR